MLTILNGPSAGGKTTLMHQLLNGAHGKEGMRDFIKQFITVTTRAPRAGEVDGVDYRFLTVGEYDAADEAGDMIEKTVYAGVKYGVLRQDLVPLFHPDHNAIVVMDFFGYAKMVEFLGKDRVNLVFVHASLDTLKARMEARGDKPDVIERRLKQATEREFVGKAFADLVINTDEDPVQNYLAVRELIMAKEMAKELYFDRAAILAHTGIDIAS